MKICGLRAKISTNAVISRERASRRRDLLGRKRWAYDCRVEWLLHSVMKICWKYFVKGCGTRTRIESLRLKTVNYCSGNTWHTRYTVFGRIRRTDARGGPRYSNWPLTRWLDVLAPCLLVHCVLLDWVPPRWLMWTVVARTEAIEAVMCETDCEQWSRINCHNCTSSMADFFYLCWLTECIVARWRKRRSGFSQSYQQADFIAAIGYCVPQVFHLHWFWLLVSMLLDFQFFISLWLDIFNRITNSMVNSKRKFRAFWRQWDIRSQSHTVICERLEYRLHGWSCLVHCRTSGLP